MYNTSNYLCVASGISNQLTNLQRCLLTGLTDVINKNLQLRSEQKGAYLGVKGMQQKL